MSGNISTASADTSLPNDRKRSRSLLSRLICSSNSECRTIAPAPASSMRLMMAWSLHKGQAETTRGFFNLNPRYFVERSIIACSFCRGLCLHRDRVRDSFVVTLSRHARPLLIHLEACVDILLRFAEQERCRLWIAVTQHGVARLVVDVFLQRDRRRLRIQGERTLAL